MDRAMLYRNFDLEVLGRAADGAALGAVVRVADSPAGSTAPADAERAAVTGELRRDLARLEQRQVPRDELIALGRALGAVLFPPGARQLLERSLAGLRGQDRLRLRLRLATPALADLPWEYAYVDRPGTPAGEGGMEGFVALDRRMALVRHDTAAPAVTGLDPVDARPLEVVALLANPTHPDYPPLDLAAERAVIEAAVGDVAGLHLRVTPQATVDALQDALEAGAHVFHFAGHGVFAADGAADLPADVPADGEPVGTGPGGAVVLEAAGGAPEPFPAEKLALNLVASGARLAVLGACHSGRRGGVSAWSGVAPALVARGGVPAVVGMQYSIGDANATRFSGRLYEALAANQPVEAAVTAARLAVFNHSRDDDRDWGVPVLSLQAERGVLFPPPPVVRPGTTWDEVARRARRQAEGFLAAARGPKERPGRFLADAHARRTGPERALADFMAADEPALLVVGQSGMGKTTLLCQWAVDLAEAGHAVFLYDCAAALEGVERELARDLAVEREEDLDDAVARLAELARPEGRQFVVVYDGLNQFHDAAGRGPADLLRAVDRLVTRLPAAGVRVVVACTTATWHRLAREGMGPDGAGPLTWARWWRPGGADHAEVAHFSEDERDEAYAAYRRVYRLATPLEGLSAPLRQAIRVPLSLRMLAEAYRGRDVPRSVAGLGTGIVRAHYLRQVSRPEDQAFLDDVATAMLEGRRTTLPLPDLVAAAPAVRDQVERPGPDSSYTRLLDAGVLATTFDPQALVDQVGFGHSRVGAFVLARRLLRDGPAAAGGHVRALLGQAGAFPMAWEVARTLVVLAGDAGLVDALARSAEPGPVALAVEGLVELHGDDPEAAVAVMKRLVEGRRGARGPDQAQARRAGLRAASLVGGGGREVVTWAARHADADVRRAAGAALYLSWRADPALASAVLDELADGIRLRTPRVTRRVLESLGEVSVTLFANHCDRQDVVGQVSELWHTVLKKRLRLGAVPRALDRAVAAVVATVVSGRVVEAALLAELEPPERFFSLPAPDKERFARVVPLLDPAADLAPRAGDLGTLFGSGVAPCGLLAALVLAAHAYADPPGTEPVVRSLFDGLDGPGRMWVLGSFSVLLPDAAVATAWAPLLEDLTGRLAAEHPRAFYGDDATVVSRLDLHLLPLGLAEAKVGPTLPAVDRLVGQARRGDGPARLARVLAGLGPLGFAYPDPVLATLRSGLGDLAAAGGEVEASLAGTLGLVRVLHAEKVDAYLAEAGATPGLVAAVAAATDPERARRYVYWLGMYNTSVWQACHAPRMREQLLVAALSTLARSSDAKQFLARYTPVPLRMLRDADYRVAAWTGPR